MMFALALALALPVIVMTAGRGRAAEPDSADGAIELTRLMAHFAKSGNVRALFEETRHITLLNDPISTGGRLYFSPPDRLARHATRPGRSSVIAHGGRVTFRDETGTRTMDLGSSDVARSVIGNLAAFLRGDLGELRARFEITFVVEGDAEGENGTRTWQIDLEPKRKEVRAVIALIRFSGTEWTLDSMETREANGDSVLVAFSRVETNVDLAPAEFDRIFSTDRLHDDLDDKPGDKPSESSVDKPSGSPVDKPSDSSANSPANAPRAPANP